MNKTFFLDMDGVIVDLPEGSGRHWDSVNWWANLKKLPWADSLVDLLSHTRDVHILSSLGGGEASAQGKMIWLGRHYPELVADTILTRKKHLLSGPHRILIDDDPRNCEDWVKFGGYALPFPYGRDAGIKTFVGPDGHVYNNLPATPYDFIVDLNKAICLMEKYNASSRTQNLTQSNPVGHQDPRRSGPSRHHAN